MRLALALTAQGNGRYGHDLYFLYVSQRRNDADGLNSGAMTEAAVYSESTKKLIQRYLALSYYLYCLQLAALYQFFITFAIVKSLKLGKCSLFAEYRQF